VVSHYSYTLFVSLRNFVCKISEDTELLMALYDAKEGRVFTENYVVRWNKDSLMKDPDQLHNLRVLFTVSTFFLFMKVFIFYMELIAFFCLRILEAGTFNEKKYT